MRVLITMPWGRRLGGAEAMLQTVLDGAHESGHELELVFLEPGPWPAELRAAGLRVEVLSAGRLRDVHRWVATVARLARLMRRRRPDVILNWSAKTQLYGSPAAVLAGMRQRVVWWQHAIQDGHWLDRCATALPARAVGCSSQTTADAQARLRPARATFVVAPGTRAPDGGAPAPPGSRASDGARAPAPPALPEGVPVVGLVGRLEPWKGQDRLLQAHALLREEGHRLHTVIVGGDAYDLSPEYARSIPELVRRLGLEGEVTLTGQVPDAGPYIEHMDVLVNASDREPFGIVLLEGMARGVAVVAVDAGGPAELIEDGRTGVLARSGEPRALADALAPLLDSPARRRELGAAGRERYARDFTDAAMRERFFGRLEALGAPRTAPRSSHPAPGVPPPMPGAPHLVPVTLVAHDVGEVGGMERQLAALALGLRWRGHEVHVIARTCELPPDAGVVFHRVPGPSRPFVVAYPWFALAGSLAVWRHRRGVVQATGAIVCNRVDAIAVHCCHQVHRPSPHRPGALQRRYTRAVGLFARVCERLCFRANRTATLVCVSDGVAAEVRAHFPAQAAQVVTIHNGVDTAAFAPGTRAPDARALRERLAIAPQRLVLAFVGGDWGHKGLRPVIEALAHASEWDLLVAGRGHVPPYRELAESLGVASAIHWLGVVRDMPVIYESANAFVLASGYETFSLVTFEAAAAGLPILATPVNGVRELIEDGRTGLLIAPEPDSIATALRRLASDPALRQRLGSAARDAVLGFSWEAMVARHEELYEAGAGALSWDAR